MSQSIDIALLAAKLATLNDEKARLVINATSFAYNVAEVSRLQSLLVEYSQICHYVVLNAKYRGYYTDEESKLVHDCQRHVTECTQLLAKHRTMTVVDGISLIVEMMHELEKK